MNEVVNVEEQMRWSGVSFSFCVVAETVCWVSLGRSNQHTLIRLLHFPSTARWLSHSAETWAWINCHTLTDYLPRMLFCAGRMFEMPVTDTLHPPPASLLSPTHTVFYNVPLSSSGRVQCSIAELCRAYFFCVFWSVWACRHTLWQCGVTRQHVSCSHKETLWRGWFTAQLFTPSCLFLQTLPSVFLNEHLPLYLLSVPF